MSKVAFSVLILLFFFFSDCLCGDMISAIIENANGEQDIRKLDKNQHELDINVNKLKNFKQGNKRWFKAKKDLMKFTPQKGIELGKKIARNASIGVIWIYEPGLLLAEELVSPCFGLISYYPNVQVTVMKGERFLGIICDAREFKPINTDRFKWYVAIGNDLVFTARHYVKEGAYIKEGQELGHLSRPAKSVGRVAIKSRARCSGIIVLCKTGPVETGEEFLRISCDAATGTNDVKNSLVDQTHTSLLDQSDMGKSIPKLRGLAQISPEEANYDGNNFKLPQIINSGEESEVLDDEDEKIDHQEQEQEQEQEKEQEEKISKKNTPDWQDSNKNVNKKCLENLSTIDDSNYSSESDLKTNNKIIQTQSGAKNANFFDFDFDDEEDDGNNDEIEYKKIIEGGSDESDHKVKTEKFEKEKMENLEKEKLEKEIEEQKHEKEKGADMSPHENSNYQVMLQSHKNKNENSRKPPEKKSNKNFNKINSIETGKKIDLDGLSSSIVSEAEISALD